MNQHNDFNEVTYHHEPSESTSRIWKTFWLLLIITIIELGLGLLMHVVQMPGWMHLFLKGVIIILSLAKAFYIVSIFMHLGDEIRNLIMTIVMPLLLFVWFIGAFLYDGNDYRTRRNRYDTHFTDRTMPANQQQHMNAADTSTHPLD